MRAGRGGAQGAHAWMTESAITLTATTRTPQTYHRHYRRRTILRAPGTASGQDRYGYIKLTLVQAAGPIRGGWPLGRSFTRYQEE
jgi:hypothetical protein